MPHSATAATAATAAAADCFLYVRKLTVIQNTRMAKHRFIKELGLIRSSGLPILAVHPAGTNTNFHTI